MDQKRPERADTDRDVCLNEKETKSRKRIYDCLMNCAAPMLTVAFLTGSVCWAVDMRYSSREEYDSNPEAAAVFSPEGIADDTGLHVETRLPEGMALSDVPENTGAELVEACGVYVDNNFIGAVVNGEHIEDELDLVLEEYKSDDSVIEADYAVETELKQGVYRSAALVSDEDMTHYLTGEKEIITEYTVGEDDTPEKLADNFGMTVDEVKRLNPDIKNIKKGDAVRIKETVSVLPVRYTCEVTEEEELNWEMIMKNTGYLSSEKGRRVSRYEVTYVDGAEVSRELIESETIIDPMEEEYYSDSGLYTESIPETEYRYVTDEFIWPVNGGYISDTFVSDRNHKGMDIAAPGGTDIYASAGGVVTDAGWNDGGYGNYVVIDHGNGYTTLYGHASEVYVSAGQTVSAGELIAAVGSTGDSTGNHCHFEVIYNGNYLDPAIFICG